MKLIDVTPASWLLTQRPGPKSRYRSPAAVRAMELALESVDLDISMYGQVMESTVDKCRDALALARGQTRRN